MKVRAGFVSNSSSSSYTCQICQRTESGWDLGLSDALMTECENGHIICDGHIIGGKDASEPSNETIKRLLLKWWTDSYSSMEPLRKELEPLEGDDLLFWVEDNWDMWVEWSYDYGMPEEFCPVCQFVEPSSSDMASYLLGLTEISREDVFKIVKEKNRRRRKLYDFEYVSIVCQKEGIGLIELMAGLKEKFGTYKKFKEAISEG